MRYPEVGHGGPFEGNDATVGLMMALIFGTVVNSLMILVLVVMVVTR